MTTIEKKPLKVGKQVDTNHVDTVIRNYKKKRWIQNSQRIGKEDSLSVWYSIEELEEFMAKAKDHGADGIRMYFGVYDPNFKEKPEYSERQSVVLVATKVKTTPAGVTDKDVYITTEKGNSILAYNLGRPCPPSCGTKDVTNDDGSIGITIIDNNDGMIVA